MLHWYTIVVAQRAINTNLDPQEIKINVFMFHLIPMVRFSSVLSLRWLHIDPCSSGPKQTPPTTPVMTWTKWEGLTLGSSLTGLWILLRTSYWWVDVGCGEVMGWGGGRGCWGLISRRCHTLAGIKPGSIAAHRLMAGPAWGLGADGCRQARLLLYKGPSRVQLPTALTVWEALMCPAAHCPHCLRGLHVSDCPLPSLSEGPSHVWLPTALTARGAFTRLTAHCPHCQRGLHTSDCPLPSLPEGPSYHMSDCPLPSRVQLPTALTV